MPETHFPAKAKNVIYLHMVGGPPQMDLYDYKPKMREWYDKDLPDSVRKGQRLTTMTAARPASRSRRRSIKFAQHGKCGMWVTELLPWTAKMVDDMCFIRSMHTEAINHEPAITYMQTGNQVTGRPCLGAWASATASARSTRTCRRSWCWSPSRPTRSRCRRSRRGCGQSGYLSGEHAGVSLPHRRRPDPVTSTIRRASPPTFAARRSTG